MSDEELKKTPKNYQWPADKLTAEEMAILYRIREATGVPINHLLRDAVLKLKEIAASDAKEPLNIDNQNTNESDPNQPR